MENFKLSVNSIDYFVNEKKNCVTCRVDYTVKAADETLMLIFGTDMFVGADIGTAVATARLHTDDKFDVDTGMKVARAKAESLAYRQVANYLADTIEIYSRKLMHPAMKFMEKADSVIEHNDAYLAQF